MCGICGIVVPRGSSRRLDAELLERMRDAIAHRGPDGAGIYLDDGVALGHRRLSIVDVAHGQQPMPSDDGNLQIVYNGEVYNHPELMATLRTQGVTYRTHCDTEQCYGCTNAMALPCPSSFVECLHSASGTATGVNCFCAGTGLVSNRCTTSTQKTVRSTLLLRSRRCWLRTPCAPR